MNICEPRRIVCGERLYVADLGIAWTKELKKKN